MAVILVRVRSRRAKHIAVAHAVNRAVPASVIHAKSTVILIMSGLAVGALAK